MKSVVGLSSYNTINGIKKQVLHREGFTIVELLIVVVVIAILVAITIVSYNGITNQAKSSAAQQAAQQAAQKVMAYQITNTDYPSTLADLSLEDTDSIRYTYIVSNATSAKNYCISATNKSTPIIAYAVSSTSGGVMKGECITNTAINPSATTMTGYAYAGAPGANSIVSSGGYSGSTFVRRSYSGSGTGGLYFGVRDTPNSLQISAGETYTLTAYVRASSPVTLRAAIEWKDSANIVGTTSGPTVNVGTNWVRLTATGTAPVGSFQATTTYYIQGAWSAGSYNDLDAVQFTASSAAFSYGDGDSPGWFWNGTPHDSTSTGPAELQG